MQSPSHEPASGLDAVSLAALSLEPAMSAASSSRHIFAFESGATWGSGGTIGNSDWGIPSGANSFGGDGKDTTITAQSFLSLSSATPWGASAVPGLSVSQLGGASLSGEHGRPTGE